MEYENLTNVGRRYKRISVDMKNMIINKFQNGKSYRQISEELDIGVSTISGIIKGWKTRNSIQSSRNSSGRKKKLSLEDELLIKEGINADCSLTLMK